MHGKIIQFKAVIDNFKVKNGLVTVNLTADSKTNFGDEMDYEVSTPTKYFCLVFLYWLAACQILSAINW